MEQAAGCTTLPISLFVLGDYSEGIATGQRALRKLLELEATLETETEGCRISLHHRDPLSRQRRRLSGMSLVTAARRMYREDGVTEDALSEVLGRIEKSARAALGDEGYEAAVRSGEPLARDEAIELALSITAD